ncbi:hypothetical protein Btru_041184 [Bulinus truncatus]|nr:hypothetical protein Btru_041184 [Bulinus truncatus]
MGSGSLNITKNNDKYTTCPCEECLNSNKPAANFRCVWITTALHVVENDEQVKATLVTVDFDDEQSKVILLKGHRLVNKDLEANRCILECVTHNTRPNLAVVISHPHGRPKRVSIGKIKEKIVVNQPEAGVQKTYFKHDVPTCPGSSGAVLWILGFERIGYMDRGITDHTHSMGAEGNENFSGQEKDFPLINGIISHNHVHL